MLPLTVPAQFGHPVQGKPFRVCIRPTNEYGINFRAIGSVRSHPEYRNPSDRLERPAVTPPDDEYRRARDCAATAAPKVAAMAGR